MSKRTSRRNDLHIIGVSQNTDIVTVSTLVHSNQFPNYFHSLKWNLTARKVALTFNTSVWLIVIVREGTSIGTINLIDGVDLYTPTDMILAHGFFLAPSAGANPEVTMNTIGQSDARHHLTGFDTVLLITKASAFNSHTIKGSVSYMISMQ